MADLASLRARLLVLRRKRSDEPVDQGVTPEQLQAVRSIVRHSNAIKLEAIKLVGDTE